MLKTGSTLIRSKFFNTLSSLCWKTSDSPQLLWVTCSNYLIKCQLSSQWLGVFFFLSSWNFPCFDCAAHGSIFAGSPEVTSSSGWTSPVPQPFLTEQIHQPRVSWQTSTELTEVYQYISYSRSPKLDSRCNLKSDEWRGIMTFCALLAVHFFLQPCWFMLSIVSTRTPRSLSTKQQPSQSVPSL